MRTKRPIITLKWIFLAVSLVLLSHQSPTFAGGGACTPTPHYSAGDVVKYRFEGLSAQFSASYEKALIKKAFGLWSNLAEISMSEVSSGEDVLIRWLPLSSGAQGGYFHSLRAIVFNSTLQWSDNGTTDNDLFFVAAHEMGHALGLCHTTGFSDIMGQPHGFSLFKRFLRRADIDQFASLYPTRPSAKQVRNGLTVGDFELGSFQSFGLLRNSDGNLYTFTWSPFRSDFILSERASNWNPGSGSNWISLVAANLDGQPGDEAVAIRHAANGIYAYSIDQYGYHYLAGTSTPGASLGWINMVAGDFDNDQKDEVIAVRDSDDGFFMYGYGNSSQLALVASNTDPGPNSEWIDLAAGDFNGDGKDEFIAVRNYDNGLYLYDYDGTSKLRFLASNTGASSVTQWQFLEAGDLDNDGRDELVAVDGYEDRIHIYEWNGGSTLHRVASNRLTNSSYDWQDITVSDFDGDNRDEIMAIKKSNNGLFLFDLVNGPFGTQSLNYTTKSRHYYYDKKWTAISKLGGSLSECAVVSDDTDGNLHLFCYTPSQSPYIEWKAEG